MLHLGASSGAGFILDGASGAPSKIFTQKVRISAECITHIGPSV